MKQKNKYKILELIIGKKNVQKMKKTKILLVGAGGIGCQFAKNISKLPFQNLTVIDYDHIEQTNLNRQFYFRREHIGCPKVNVLAYEIKKIVPQMEISAICDNIYNPKFNDIFFSQFDIVISALDSIQVREYLAAKATRNRKPLIDAGTMSYHGQAYSSVRFITTCHNCQPSKAPEEAGLGCLIRSRPQRPIHCGIYAKMFYQIFFGQKGETLGNRLKPENILPNSLQKFNDQKKQITEGIYSELFDEGLLDQDIEGNPIDVVRKLKLEQAMKRTQIVQNMKDQLPKKRVTQIYEEDKLWPLQKYANNFLQSLQNLIVRKYNETVPCDFQKDDEDCMMLIHCITNLRTYNFIHNKDNKLKYLTYYQCKDLVGKVMPAIASSNAIAAALQLRQMLNLVAQNMNKLRIIHFSNQGQQRLSPCFHSSGLLSCNFCSPKVIYAKVALNMDKIHFEQFQQYAERQLFSFGRDLWSGSSIIIKNSKKGPLPNKKKPISFVSHMINQGTLEVSFKPSLKGTPLLINVTIIHNQEVVGIKRVDGQQKKQLRLQVLQYYRKLHQEKAMTQLSELKYYGHIQK